MLKKLSLLTMLLFCGPGCNGFIYGGASPLVVVATTTQLGEFLSRAFQDTQISVKTLMNAGVDPHMYKARPSDLVDLIRASVVIAHGDELEGKLAGALKNLEQKKSQKIVFLSEYIPAEQKIISETTSSGVVVYDPHVWFDVSVWLGATDQIINILVSDKHFESKKNIVLENYASYKNELQQAALVAQKKLSGVPLKQRHLITSHDAFRYWGRYYKFRVDGLQGISTLAEAGLGDMKKLAQEIRSYQIPAVFVETSVSASALQKLAQLAGVSLGGALFSDALGANQEIKESYQVGTLAGVHLHNAELIGRKLSNNSQSSGESK